MSEVKETVNPKMRCETESLIKTTFLFEAKLKTTNTILYLKASYQELKMLCHEKDSLSLEMKQLSL